MRASFHVFIGNAGATGNGSIDSDEISEAAGATGTGEAVAAARVQCQRLTREDHWHASASGTVQ
jgi:hypothetical protein